MRKQQQLARRRGGAGLQPAAKPRFAPASITPRRGASSRDRRRRAVGRGVVDDDQLVAVAELRGERAGSAGRTAARSRG